MIEVGFGRIRSLFLAHFSYSGRTCPKSKAQPVFCAITGLAKANKLNSCAVFRAGELVSVTLGGVETGARGEWWLHLTGKCAKVGKAVLPPLARHALDQYLVHRGLPMSPARWVRDTPLLGHLGAVCV